MANIYVSSTFLDLQEHRAQVEKVIRRMGHTDVAMEYYIAEDQRPVDRCLTDVETCDLYIGIFAWRYGWVPKKKNKEKEDFHYRNGISTGAKMQQVMFDISSGWESGLASRLYR